MTTTGIDSLTSLHTPTRWAAQHLRNVFRLNGSTSLIAGLVAAAIPGTVAGLLGVDHPGWVRLVGLGLIVFAVDVVVLAGTRTSRLARWAPLVIVADIAWVLGSAVTIGVGAFSVLGTTMVAATAGMVGTFATLQFRHLVGLRGGPTDAFARHDAGSVGPRARPN